MEERVIANPTAASDALVETATDQGIDPQAVVRATFELGQLREEVRSGWRRIGVPS